MPVKLLLFLLVAAGSLLGAPARLRLPAVEARRLPDGAIQPEVAVGEDGVVHLVYFQGDPMAGDLFYEESSGGQTFGDPVRVNSVPGSSIAVGNIRGARIAVGRRNSVYVVWNGSPSAARSNNGRTPMLYARLNQTHTAFEPERNLIQTAYRIDGGGSVAADRAGRVYVFWHAPAPGKSGEAERRVWVARSEDDGRTFKPERIAWTAPTGACGCCSLAAFANGAGQVFVLFRAARERIERDMYLLHSDDHGNTFTGADISPWKVGYCVMSSEAFTTGANGTLAAWETEKQIHFARLTKDGQARSDSLVGGDGNEKYPSLAEDRSGYTIVSWTQGMGWKRGGSAHWQLLNQDGQRVGEPGAADGVPAWSLVAAYARRDGSFVVLY